jgi:uncharacterized RDD family membrane protein YckC
MKPSTLYLIVSLICWPVNALVAWVIWNNIICPTFELHTLEYWQVLFILILPGCFGSAAGYFLGKILDHLKGYDD